MKRVIRLYCGFQFFFPMLLWLPIFYEYQKRIGLSDPEIFRIQSVYYLLFLLLELPTGFFADRWGYRLSLKTGSWVLLISNLLPIFFKNYPGFLLHFALIALSRSLISGAANAYLYEFLKFHGAEEEYKRAEGNARAYGLVGKVVCWAGVGAMMQWHMTLPYWLTALCAGLALLFARQLPDHFFGRERKKPQYIGPILKALRDSPLLVLIMIQGTGIFVLSRIVQVNLYQPILNAKSFDLVSHGWIMSLMTLAEAAGSASPHWVRRVLSDMAAVFVLTAAVALCLSWIALSPKGAALAGLLALAYAMGLAYPIQRKLLNDAIADGSTRAVLLSTESIIDRAACAMVAPFVGGFVAAGRISPFLNILAFATILLMLILAAALPAARKSSVNYVNA
ncbi:MAG: hypothetical protein A3J74_07535 [Elusimicrobia bacterium RIFCSPHIGHO2_02_FULL_57_9]|nr:MAG: hypothetical protein A3J74_07535 [Elusimicrobia bacterium RIFCSPHIGHO2_02_FULL_57_9]